MYVSLDRNLQLKQEYSTVTGNLKSPYAAAAAADYIIFQSNTYIKFNICLFEFYPLLCRWSNDKNYVNLFFGRIWNIISIYTIALNDVGHTCEAAGCRLVNNNNYCKLLWCSVN